MKLIADSGSTKTDWILLNNSGEQTVIQTAGFNPYYHNSNDIVKILQIELAPKLAVDLIEKIFFYGSGCSTATKCNIVETALQAIFPMATIQVDHDLLGAARALFKHDSGLACIMGTGSNSCLYDGKMVTENVPSVGYMFGDEGSGTHFGKLLLEAYLKDELPSNIKALFDHTYALSLENILDALYNQPKPNSFMAGFSPFIADHIELPFMQDLVKKSLRGFMKYQLSKYSGFGQLPIRCTGSVALHYQSLLAEVAKEFNVHIDQVVQRPIYGLAEYHISATADSDLV